MSSPDVSIELGPSCSADLAADSLEEALTSIMTSHELLQTEHSAAVASNTNLTNVFANHKFHRPGAIEAAANQVVMRNNPATTPGA